MKLKQCQKNHAAANSDIIDNQWQNNNTFRIHIEYKETENKINDLLCDYIISRIKIVM